MNEIGFIFVVTLLGATGALVGWLLGWISGATSSSMLYWILGGAILAPVAAGSTVYITNEIQTKTTKCFQEKNHECKSKFLDEPNREKMNECLARVVDICQTNISPLSDLSS